MHALHRSNWQCCGQELRFVRARHDGKPRRAQTLDNFDFLIPFDFDPARRSAALLGAGGWNTSLSRSSCAGEQTPKSSWGPHQMLLFAREKIYKKFPARGRFLGGGTFCRGKKLSTIIVSKRKNLQIPNPERTVQFEESLPVQFSTGMAFF